MNELPGTSFGPEHAMKSGRLGLRNNPHIMRAIEVKPPKIGEFPFPFENTLHVVNHRDPIHR
jgi:hypothetical protein